ncbi:hypothetical protein EVAR_83390_1 [Eumeta japonica]|uniref:Uncharacterized protein n=1 Tax=Eumeta variegata TaxID=151549 RepID=A0A4C1TYS4_EUMVA|nr:hypothetical protein EVAR_83390_1 [Eumeta japonica]
MSNEKLSCPHVPCRVVRSPYRWTSNFKLSTLAQCGSAAAKERRHRFDNFQNGRLNNRIRYLPTGRRRLLTTEPPPLRSIRKKPYRNVTNSDHCARPAALYLTIGEHRTPKSDFFLFSAGQ